MRKFLLMLLGVVVVAYVWLAFVGVEPQDRRPGTKLAGTPTAAPANWDFLADVQEVHLQTHPWHGVPFSVTVVIVNDNGTLYVPSLYESPMPFPGTKYWNTVVQSNPDVRLRVGDKLYDMRIAPVTDSAEFDTALAAFGRKFPFWQKQVESNDSARKFALLRLTPRG